MPLIVTVEIEDATDGYRVKPLAKLRIGNVKPGTDPAEYVVSCDRTARAFTHRRSDGWQACVIRALEVTTPPSPRK